MTDLQPELQREVMARVYLSSEDYFHFKIIAKKRKVQINNLLSDYLSDIARDDRKEGGE